MYWNYLIFKNFHPFLILVINQTAWKQSALKKILKFFNWKINKTASLMVQMRSSVLIVEFFTKQVQVHWEGKDKRRIMNEKGGVAALLKGWVHPFEQSSPLAESLDVHQRLRANDPFVTWEDPRGFVFPTSFHFTFLGFILFSFILFPVALNVRLSWHKSDKLLVFFFCPNVQISYFCLDDINFCDKHHS